MASKIRGVGETAKSREKEKSKEKEEKTEKEGEEDVKMDSQAKEAK